MCPTSDICPYLDVDVEYRGMELPAVRVTDLERWREPRQTEYRVLYL